jgi:hypothetical protein
VRGRVFAQGAGLTEPALLPLESQAISVLVLLLLLGWVAYLIRRQRLGLRESLLWVVSTSLALVLVLFPGLLRALAQAAGVRVPSNALFAMAFVYVLLNLLSLTIGTSRVTSQARRLSQECAMLRAEVERLRREADPDGKSEAERSWASAKGVPGGPS